MTVKGKVFGIGLSKTGTTSLYLALETLGYRSGTFRHMKELGLSDWLSGDFKRDYFPTLDAVTDLPIGTYFRELDARYPGSKFILTEREVEAWLISIERQFTADTHQLHKFNRMVRMAHYGVSSFNESRFRRLHGEHHHAVIDYFKDRPNDLMVLNLFDGQGWPEICEFLGNPVPDQAFPSVKPGFIPPKKQLPENENNGPFVFVLPVVHPDGPKVGNYESVERMLCETIRSLSAQRHENTRIVVVCHQAPPWINDCNEHVHFLVVGDHPGFVAGRNDVQLDKGMKYVLGSLFATEKLGACRVMLTDADDFVDRDLATFFTGYRAPDPERDGWMITGGYNAALRPQADKFKLLSVFGVCEFDKTCGSCRVFLADALVGHIDRLDTELLPLATGFELGNLPKIPGNIIDRIVAITDSIADQPDSIIRLFGRHVHQAPFLKFTSVKKPFVTKSCGHGNHDGPRQGEVHWHRIIALRGKSRFLREFGLVEDSAISPGLSVGLILKGFLSFSVLAPFHRTKITLGRRLGTRRSVKKILTSKIARIRGMIVK